MPPCGEPEGEDRVWAYGAVTYGDVDQLFTDLPARPPAAVPVGTAPAVPAARRPDALATGFAGPPIALKILWTIRATSLAINLTVWTLVGVGDGEITYFWPMWLLVPGAALLAATAITTSVRNGRR